MRARLALLVSGKRCEVREVKLSAKPPEMLKASPKGTVPVLVLRDGVVLEQSLDIMRWALANDDPEGWLHRCDEALIARNDGAFKHDLDRYKYPERHGTDPVVHRASGLAFLQELDGRLAGQEQLSGSTAGMTDMAIMPFVRQFAAVDATWFAQQTCPHLRGWLEGHLGSALFAAAMDRLPPWKAGDPPVFLPA